MRRLLLALVASFPVAALGLAAPAHAALPHAAAASWGWPLPGTPSVDRPFQPPASAWGAGHRGVDLRGELGEPVLAAGAGTVTYAGLLAGRGVVTVTHAGGLRTTYEPVDAVVSVGEHVDTGDVIGSLSTGHASCRLGVTCLHWGLLRGSTYLDPLSLVVAGPLQLLPIDAKAPHVKSRLQQELEDKLKKKLEQKAKQKLKQKLKRTLEQRLRSQLGRAASKAGSVVRPVVRQVVRKVVPTVTRTVAQTVARAAAVEAAAAAAVAASPGVVVAGAVVVVVVVVGGTVYYVRHRV